MSLDVMDIQVLLSIDVDDGGPKSLQRRICVGRRENAKHGTVDKSLEDVFKGSYGMKGEANRNGHRYDSPLTTRRTRLRREC